MKLTVILPTHNPDPWRLQRTLAGLCEQTLPLSEWETVLVNNASNYFPDEGFFAKHAPRSNFTIVNEPRLGLTSARQRGFKIARGELAVLVDDDNVLAPNYLEQVIALFLMYAHVGALGGKSIAEFSLPPPTWAAEFFPLLALRDLGPETVIAESLRPTGANANTYPSCAPIGAGMALRRSAWQAWFKASDDNSTKLSDRRGGELSSAGDNDIVFCAMRAGHAVGYFPSLALTHLIPAARLEPAYLARLNHGIQKSWMQVLLKHDACPWPTLPKWTVPLRKMKTWHTHRAWQGHPERIRWHGACGHFEGRVS